MKLAIVGKRNAGKSTFINALAGQRAGDRLRDARHDPRQRGRERRTGRADVHRHRHGRAAQDDSRSPDDIEFYSHHRAMRSHPPGRRGGAAHRRDRADLAGGQAPGRGDHRASSSPTVLVVQQVGPGRRDGIGQDYLDYFAKMFPELSFAPISLTSAVTGQNLRETVDLAAELFAQASVRIPTARMNEADRGDRGRARAAS